MPETTNEHPDNVTRNEGPGNERGGYVQAGDRMRGGNDVRGVDHNHDGTDNVDRGGNNPGPGQADHPGVDHSAAGGDHEHSGGGGGDHEHSGGGGADHGH